MHYLIIHKQGALPPRRVEHHELKAVANRIARRNLPWPALVRSMRTNGRTYVRLDSRSPYRENYGRGFIIQKVSNL